MENSAANSNNNGRLNDQYLVAKKRRVIKFIRCWMLITREHFFQQQQIQSFLAVSSFLSPSAFAAPPKPVSCLRCR